jgi:hypothetical protein
MVLTGKLNARPCSGLTYAATGGIGNLLPVYRRYKRFLKGLSD